MVISPIHKVSNYKISYEYIKKITAGSNSYRFDSCYCYLDAFLVTGALEHNKS